jgi:tetratricopeptide (TPR) repeat protein
MDSTVFLALGAVVSAALLAPPGARAEDLPALETLWDFSDPAKTEARFREVLPKAEASGDADYLARLLTQIARAQGLQTRFADGHTTLDRAERVRPKDVPATRVRVLLERGRLHNSAKEAEKARPLFVQAFEAAREAGLDALAVDAAHMVAIAEKGAESDAWNEKAIAIGEASKDPKASAWLGTLYNNLAWTRFDRKDYAGSKALQEKAVAWFEARGQASAARTARWSIARVLRAMGKVEDALAVQRGILAETEKAGEEDGFVSEEVGECLFALGRAEEARPHFRRAHGLLSKDPFLARDQAERLARLERLGREGGEAPTPPSPGK